MIPSMKKHPFLYGPSFEDTLVAEYDSINGGIVTEETETTTVTKTEEEQAFIIDAENPKEVLARLCMFEKLTKTYFVGAGELLHIVDTLYDSPEGIIKSSKGSIRVREVNGKPYITMKGKNESKDNASKRAELEVAWPWNSNPSPHDVASLFGMEPIQVRQTERIARPIFRNYDNKIIAELAIDKVNFGFASVYEIEIEMKSSQGAQLWSLTKDLQKKFPELKTWKGSKYAMGTVLEQALAIQKDENGFLTPESFVALSKLKVL